MTKQELQEYFWIQKKIQHLENKLFELESDAQKVTTTLSNEPQGNTFSSDRVGDIVTDMIAVKEEISSYLKLSYAAIKRIEKAAESLPAREGYLIRLRYIDCKRWEEIAVDMGYTWQHIHKIHSSALKLLA